MVTHVAGTPQIAAQASDSAFLVKPYLQLGDASPASAAADLALLWHVEDVAADWTVEYRSGDETTWRVVAPPTSQRIAVPGIAPHRLVRTVLKGLVPGSICAYRVRKGGEIVFAAEGSRPQEIWPALSVRVVWRLRRRNCPAKGNRASDVPRPP